MRSSRAPTLLVVAAIALAAPTAPSQEAPPWWQTVERDGDVAGGAVEIRRARAGGNPLTLRFPPGRIVDQEAFRDMLRRIEAHLSGVRLTRLTAVAAPPKARGPLAVESITFSEGEGSVDDEALGEVSRALAAVRGRFRVAPSLQLELGPERMSLVLELEGEFATSDALDAAMDLVRRLDGRVTRIAFEEGRELALAFGRGAPPAEDRIVAEVFGVCDAFRIAEKVRIAPHPRGAEIRFLRKEGYRLADLARLVTAVEQVRSGARLVQADFGRRDEGGHSIWRPRRMLFESRSARPAFAPLLDALAATQGWRQDPAAVRVDGIRLGGDHLELTLAAADEAARQAFVEAAKTWPGVLAYEPGSLGATSERQVLETRARLRLRSP